MNGRDPGRNGPRPANRVPRARGLVMSAALICALPAPCRSASLAEVLDRIAGMGVSPLGAIFLNASFNAPRPLIQPRGLQPGQRVIVGFDPLGSPVHATAGETGLLVSPELAGSLSSGLAAGLYPPGSALYSLPPAGQLSLYEADRNGDRLDRATESVLAAVDGSITNIIESRLLPDLAPVRAMAGSLQPPVDRMVDFDTVSSTVLGAVNSGEIIAAIRVETLIADHLPVIDIDAAGIALGGSFRLDESAILDGVAAQSLAIRQPGGTPDARSLVANLSSNLGAVNGRIANHIAGQGVNIASITSTVIGSVNAGIVDADNGSAPDLQR